MKDTKSSNLYKSRKKKKKKIHSTERSKKPKEIKRFGAMSHDKYDSLIFLFQISNCINIHKCLLIS